MNNSIKTMLISDLDSQIENKLSTFEFLKDVDQWVLNETCQRPIRPKTFKYIDKSDVKENTALNYSALCYNRLLTCVYETEMLFLDNDKKWPADYFCELYSEKFKNFSNNIEIDLYKRALSYVDLNVQVNGKWKKADFEKYYTERIKPNLQEKPKSLTLIENSPEKENVAKLLLIQHALDFLVESSHMARYCKGDYGKHQSELFKVMIDEFGYGVHSKKHSTLFKDTMRSVGLSDKTHAYWQFYLNTTFQLNNLFHYYTKYPRNFFKYVGAITLAENAFGPYCSYTAIALKKVFGMHVDTKYYMEHDHIDDHHGRMTYEDLLLGLIDSQGEKIIPEIVLGIEQVLYLQKIAEDDLIAQIEWMSKKTFYNEMGNKIKPAVLASKEKIPYVDLVEPHGELSVTHVHDGDELCAVEKGSLNFYFGPDCYVTLHAGDSVIIAKNRLHGSVIVSDECHFTIYSIGDYRRYASN